MSQYSQLLAVSHEIENSFEKQGHDSSNANPLDLIYERKPASCAARAFILAVSLDKILETETVRFMYNRKHGQPSQKDPSGLVVAHAQVEVDDGNFEPFIISPEYPDNATARTIEVFAAPKMSGAYGPTFDDPVEGLKTYCQRHPGLIEFDPRDVDRAYEILVNHDFGAQLQDAA